MPIRKIQIEIETTMPEMDIAHKVSDILGPYFNIKKAQVGKSTIETNERKKNKIKTQQ